MIEPIDGLIDKDRFIEEMYEQESWTSSGSFRDLLICPSLRSYSSLDLLSCKNKDEEECRLVNLNNVIKKLFDTIDDPIKKEDLSFVCCLLGKLMKYNGTDGFYAKHLPQIGEILEFLAMQAKKFEQYLYYLYALLELCCKPLLLQRISEILSIKPKLQRYFSLLGYLLVLAPTKASFDMVKRAIEVLVSKDEDKTRKDTVKPDVRHEAVEQSRLPLTLAELTEVASTETYPAVLQLTLAVASVSRICCHRMLEAEIESRILIRLHPAYECGFECLPVTDQTNLLLDKEDYIKTAECATKILYRLMTSIIIADELPNELKVDSPSKPAMWSLQAAFRRELLQARGSTASRKLRNELANLILTGITRCTAQWQLAETGLIDDLSNFFVASEFEINDGWAKTAKVEVNNTTGLEFKKTLLTILARIVDVMPECVTTLKNKHLIAGILQLLEPTSVKSARMLWNSEQLWHLFKYAANALTYLVPKIPNEFIEDNGTQRLLLVLKRFTSDADYDNALITCFTEMLCSLSLANCDMITRQFREYGFIPILFKMIRRILNFEALAIKHQRVMTYLLVAAENILSIDDCSDECFCDTNIKITMDLLHRCLHQKDEDSELEQSFLIAIGTFAWKCVIHCPSALRNFIQAGGLYQSLDITERANLPVQNLYLAMLADISENEFCRRYLFSWKRSSDKRKGILSLLANVWRQEENIFGVERTNQGCILNTETPLLNDEQWLYVNYLKSACDLDVLTTIAVGSVRPKIHHLLKLVVRHADNCREHYFKRLFDKLSTEDQITILAIESYTDLKSDEASLQVLSQLKITPLTKSRSPLLESASKLDLWSERTRAVQERQEKLLEKSRAVEIKKEMKTLERIRHAKLNPAFDALTELSYVLATSDRSYRLAKLQEMKTMKNPRCREFVRGPLFETCNFRVNVTNVFNKEVIIQSIPTPSVDTTIEKVSTISSSTTRLSSGHSYCTTTCDDDSLKLQNYELDDNGNLILKSASQIYE